MHYAIIWTPTFLEIEEILVGPAFLLFRNMTREIKPNVDPNVIRVFVVRHGRTEFNLKKVIQGHLDIDLDETGHDQASKLAKYLEEFKFDACVTSDLCRCRSTIKDILLNNSHLSEDKIRITPNLRERMMGPAQGMFIGDALAKYGDKFKSMGEQEEALIERVEGEWDLVLKKAATEDHLNTLFCTHGGVITSFTNYLHLIKKYGLGEGLEAQNLRVPFNTSITVIDVDKATGEGVIQKFGVTEHLGGHFEVKNQDLR